MQCSMNRSCCRVLYCFLILVGFICAVELVFGSLLAVCVVGLFCNVGLCLSSIFVTSFKDVSQQLLHYCERSIHKQL